MRRPLASFPPCAFKKLCARGDEKAKAQKKKKEKPRKSDARGTAREADVQWHKSRVMDHTAGMEAIAWRDAGVHMLEELRGKVGQWVVLTSVSLATSLLRKAQLEPSSLPNFSF